MQIWRESELAIWIGDQLQLGDIVMSKPKENPFVDQLQMSPFVLFVENGFSYSMLREVMRMIIDLEVI